MSSSARARGSDAEASARISAAHSSRTACDAWQRRSRQSQLFCGSSGDAGAQHLALHFRAQRSATRSARLRCGAGCVSVSPCLSLCSSLFSLEASARAASRSVALRAQFSYVACGCAKNWTRRSTGRVSARRLVVAAAVSVCLLVGDAFTAGGAADASTAAGGAPNSRAKRLSLARASLSASRLPDACVGLDVCLETAVAGVGTPAGAPCEESKSGLEPLRRTMTRRHGSTTRSHTKAECKCSSACMKRRMSSRSRSGQSSSCIKQSSHKSDTSDVRSPSPPSCS
mmetsp:Transcript_15979/g.34278  ORF Transcript_15979/g.34278 Transcript_15979/m.34278 type:complete len:285 (-) Transcript_15979:326-1180(-)